MSVQPSKEKEPRLCKNCAHGISPIGESVHMLLMGACDVGLFPEFEKGKLTCPEWKAKP